MTPWNIHPAAEDELEAAFEHFLGVDFELAHSLDNRRRPGDAFDSKSGE